MEVLEFKMRLIYISCPLLNVFVFLHDLYDCAKKMTNSFCNIVCCMSFCFKLKQKPKLVPINLKPVEFLKLTHSSFSLHVSVLSSIGENNKKVTNRIRNSSDHDQDY